MDQERTQDDVARLLMERFDPQWFFWSKLTWGIRMVEEKECHQKKGFRDLSPWISAIRQRIVPGVSRYQSGNIPVNIAHITPVVKDSLPKKQDLGQRPRSPSGLFAETW